MIDLEELKRLNEKATPAPWGIWADQPSVLITRSDDQIIADVDTYTGKGCLDADLIIYLRNHVQEIIQLLSIDDAPEERGQTLEDLNAMYGGQYSKNQK